MHDNFAELPQGKDMSRRSVVVVEPHLAGSMFAPAVRRAGFRSCAVTLPAVNPAYAQKVRLTSFDEHIESDGSDIGALISQLRALDTVAVIPGHDQGVELADYLAHALTPDLANVPELSSARRHKGDMYAAVAAHGLPVIRGLCTADPEEGAYWLDRESMSACDLVVKPAKAAGTYGVTLVPAGGDWRSAMSGLVGAVDCYGQDIAEVVIQEYARGVEYAVDTFSYEGTHTITDIARYNKVSSQKHIAVYESMEFVPYDLPGLEAVVSYVEQVLDALGFTFGQNHTEVMLTDRGPLLIETNARLPGGGQPSACQLATGNNGVDPMIQYLTRERPIRAEYAFEMTVLVVFFGVRSAGNVSNIGALDAIMDLPSCCNLQVKVRDGDYVPETHDLFDTQDLGTVVLAHSDQARVYADYAAARRIASSVGRPGGFVL